jgi:type II secretory pathway pseudopilin PulG
LLIVAAIIAILAAIAVPNFLEAQTRAKVSRVKADLRVIACGLEAYCVDHNQYPQAGNNGWARWLCQLSTPVAYLAEGRMMDPFENRRAGLWQREHPYYYYGMNETQALNTYTSGQLYLPSPARGGSCRIHWWMMISAGPDCERNYFGGTIALNSNLTDPDRFTLFIYDPTNGTLSLGDIIRPGGSPYGASADGLRGSGR